MLKNYDGVLRIDGEMGEKKLYDPRSYLKKGEAGMKKRVLQASEELRSLGKSIYGEMR
jgi:fructose-bisphosphate aldolase class II